MAAQPYQVTITIDPDIDAVTVEDVAITLKAVLDLKFDGPKYAIEVEGTGLDLDSIHARVLDRWAWTHGTKINTTIRDVS